MIALDEVASLDIAPGAFFFFHSEGERAVTVTADVSQEKTTPMKVMEEGYDLLIAVDGPPPPLIYHKAKAGIIYLSRKTRVPIVPIKMNIHKKFIFSKRWDKYEIPIPFSKVEMTFGKPFVADETTTTEQLEESMLGIA